MKTLRWIAAPLLALTSATWAAETDVSRLINQLREPATRTQASLMLVEMGAPAISSLMGNVCDKDTAIATWSCETIRRIVLRARDRGAAYDRTQLCAVLIDVLKTDTRPAARELAAEMLGLIGRDESVAPLKEALRCDCVRPFAMSALQQIPDKAAAEALVGFAKSAPRTEDRVDAIRCLGQRGCKVSLGALSSWVKDKDVAIQMAAVSALAEAGDLAALPTILGLIDKGADLVKAAAMQAGLKLAEVAIDQGKKDKALGVYDKLAGMPVSSVYRSAVIAGYARVAGKIGAARLIGLLGKFGAQADAQIIEALSRITGGEVTAAIVEGYGKATADVKVALLTTLGWRSDPQGSDTLLAGAKDTDVKVAVAAIEAMGAIGNAKFEPAISQALTQGASMVKAAAVRAVLSTVQRLSREDRVKNEAQIAKLSQDILANSPDDAGKVTALNAIAELGCKPLIGEVEKLLAAAPPEVRQAAVRAYAAIADKLDARANQGQALAMYNRLIDMGAVSADRFQAVADRMKACGDKSNLAERLGVITQWYLVGPWANPNSEAFDKVFFPEKEIELGKTYKEGGKDLKWKPVTTGDLAGRLNLRQVVVDAENVAAYAYAEVNSDIDQDVVFKAGSDDGMKFWLNGKQLFAKNEPRALTPDMDTIPGRLNKGVNRILIKVLNGVGLWELHVRVTSPDGKPLRLKVRPAVAVPPPPPPPPPPAPAKPAEAKPAPTTQK